MEQNYNKGEEIGYHLENTVRVVDDIISNLQFFGFMGLIRQGPEFRDHHNDLYRDVDLTIPDVHFMESKKSFIKPANKTKSKTDLVIMMEGLVWKPIKNPLILDICTQNLEFDSINMLKWNSDLSSMIALIASNESLMESFFPQTKMNLSHEDERRCEQFHDQINPILDEGEHAHSHTRLFYEGFVCLFDQGYRKSIFVNAFMPYVGVNDKSFYLRTKSNEAWIQIIVKALAKYFGSYDELSRTTFE
jgi:hypothetical protein